MAPELMRCVSAHDLTGSASYPSQADPVCLWSISFQLLASIFTLPLLESIIHVLPCGLNISKCFELNDDCAAGCQCSRKC